MNHLLEKILANHSNQKLFALFKIGLREEHNYFKTWSEAKSPMDDCGIYFFDVYGKDIPSEYKYVFQSTHLLVQPDTGFIFAFTVGRFSIFFRCDFDRSGIANTDEFRRGYTVDCVHDITPLGENWAYLEKFIEEEDTQLFWSYELYRQR